MLECVVNISEGRDTERLDEFACLAGAALLDLHADGSHNRSVFTLAGPEAEAAAEELAPRRGRQSRHQRHDGVHPRLGVVDVVPFVPLGPDAMRARRRSRRGDRGARPVRPLGGGRARRPVLPLRPGTLPPRDPPPRLPRSAPDRTAPPHPRRGDLRRGASGAHRLQPLARRDDDLRPGAPDRPTRCAVGRSAYRRLRGRHRRPGLLQPRRRPGRSAPPTSTTGSPNQAAAIEPGGTRRALPRAVLAATPGAVGRRSSRRATRRSRRASPTGGIATLGLRSGNLAALQQARPRTRRRSRSLIPPEMPNFSRAIANSGARCARCNRDNLLRLPGRRAPFGEEELRVDPHAVRPRLPRPWTWLVSAWMSTDTP